MVKIGYALCGSFCTIQNSLKEMKKLEKYFNQVIEKASEHSPPGPAKKLSAMMKIVSQKSGSWLTQATRSQIR